LIVVSKLVAVAWVAGGPTPFDVVERGDKLEALGPPSPSLRGRRAA